MMENEQEVISIQKVIGQQQLLLLLSMRHIYWLLMVLTNYFSMAFVVVDRLFVVVVVVEFDFVLMATESLLLHSSFPHHLDLPMLASFAEN
jgi:hypothetical protein